MRPDAWFHASDFTASLRGHAIGAFGAGHASYDVFTASLLPFPRDMPVYVRQATHYAAPDCRGGYSAVPAFCILYNWCFLIKFGVMNFARFHYFRDGRDRHDH